MLDPFAIDEDILDANGRRNFIARDAIGIDRDNPVRRRKPTSAHRGILHNGFGQRDLLAFKPKLARA